MDGASANERVDDLRAVLHATTAAGEAAPSARCQNPAGTDGGIGNIPGFSLHKEFRELAAAGLSPLEVLQATTLNGSEYLNRQSSMGSVDVGKKTPIWSSSTAIRRWTSRTWISSGPSS